MRYIVIIVLLFVTINVKAQSQFDYKSAIGIRVGYLSSGLTFKRFLTSQIAFDNWITTRQQGFMYTGLVEFHKSNRNRKINHANLNFYAGIGGHLLLFSENEKTLQDTVATAGADIIIGFEKKVSDKIVFGLDIKPQYEFLNPNPNKLDFCVGIDIRYMF